MSRENISLGENKLVVETNTGQAISWSVGGRDIFYVGSSDKRSGVPVLFPFADPLENDTLNLTGGNLPQHGFGRSTSWNVVSKNQSQITMEITEKDISKESREAYPFEFQCQQKYSIENNILEYSIGVINNSNSDIPIAPGIHPYFNIIHENKQKISINNGDSFSGKEVNWEIENTGYFTNFNGTTLVDLIDYKIEIREITNNKSFQNLVVWSQPKTKEDYNFVCIEPFTRKTNGINLDPIIIKPNQKWESAIQIKLA